jgi:hypothetical protein
VHDLCPHLVATHRRRRGVFLPSAAVYCRRLYNNAITAIPGGLFNFATALTELYGRPPLNLGALPDRPANTCLFIQLA